MTAKSSFPVAGASEGRVPALPFGATVKAIGDPLRLRILRELGSGDRLMVTEIAGRLRVSANLVSKHLAVLRRVGLVDIRQRLYGMPRHVIVDGDRQTLDLGFCVLKLDRIGG
ncbi:MAG: helix-turn-helix transcriptional regulator [Verrucomicrobiales bacterium]|nr:helix-turn-helix transcriptional regulator [Verrucomicrobiales bacterium]